MKTVQLDIIFLTGLHLSLQIIQVEWAEMMRRQKSPEELVFTDTEGFMYTISTKDILYYRTKES